MPVIFKKATLEDIEVHKDIHEELGLEIEDIEQGFLTVDAENIYDLPVEFRDKIASNIDAKTLAHRFDAWMSNFRENLPAIWEGRSITELEKLKGSAVLVGAGHSWKKNIHLLENYNGNVIAVDRMLEEVCKYTTPEWVVYLESNRDPNYEFLHNKIVKEKQKDIKLLASTICHPDVVRDWEGEVYWYNVEFTALAVNVSSVFYEISCRNKDVPCYASGGSVGNLAYWFTATFFANPIGLIGMDFADEDEFDSKHVITYPVLMVYANNLLNAIRECKKLGTVTVDCSTGILKAPWLKKLKLKTFVNRCNNGFDWKLPVMRFKELKTTISNSSEMNPISGEEVKG